MYSVLVLNREIVNEHSEVWTEVDVHRRSETVARVIAEVWPIG